MGWRSRSEWNIDEDSSVLQKAELFCCNQIMITVILLFKKPVVYNEFIKFV
jgi:hypothetical protein